MHIPTRFTRTGIFAPHAPKVPITRFQVLGERSSGTNLTKRLLGRNSVMKPTELLGWKHGFSTATAIPPNLAVILMVRNARDWARSMHAKPWHTTPKMQNLPFSDFIRHPWDTVVDRPRYFNDARDMGTVGQPLQLDRHPLTGARFENLFALRRAKLEGILSYLDRDCTAILVRAEQVQNHPEKTLDRILQILKHPNRHSAFSPVYKRLGSKFLASVEKRPETPANMNQQDLAFMQTALDDKLESALGYSYH